MRTGSIRKLALAASVALFLTSPVLLLALPGASGGHPAGAAHPQSIQAAPQCKLVGGTVTTNFGAIDQNTTMGTATGDLRGAVSGTILGAPQPGVGNTLLARPRVYIDTAAMAEARRHVQDALSYVPFVQDDAWHIFLLPEKEWSTHLTKKQRGVARACYTFLGLRVTYCNVEWVSEASIYEVAHTMAHEYGHILCNCADERIAEWHAAKLTPGLLQRRE